jgi:cytidylate kinase
MITDTVMTNRFEEQFQKWNELKNKNETVDKVESPSKIWERPVITMSCEPGCSIGAITPLFAQGFGLDVFDSDIVDLIAQNANLSRRMVETLDEKTRSDLDEWLAEEVFDDEFTSKTYLQNLRAVIFTIAAHGNAIIVGRGAAFLIQEEDRLSLRFVAPLGQRLKHVMTEQNLSEHESREYIDKIAQRHHLFVKKHFHADVENPVHYNLVFNTALNKPKMIFEIVKTILSGTEPV